MALPFFGLLFKQFFSIRQSLFKRKLDRLSVVIPINNRCYEAL